ncbi:unnamed protein product [Pelagomonas calceolata]|uniref:Uncharacterized protein n=1 Tax=Pelagomonas calceolata TaxID=35677 RepID=A0A8J2T3B9_9STRA|nr:unnamed protein product [Pelagomonas calceolata]
MVDEMDAETMRLMLDQVLKENQQLKAEIADVRTSKKSMKKLQLLPDLDLGKGSATRKLRPAPLDGAGRMTTTSRRRPPRASRRRSRTAPGRGTRRRPLDLDGELRRLDRREKALATAAARPRKSRRAVQAAPPPSARNGHAALRVRRRGVADPAAAPGDGGPAYVTWLAGLDLDEDGGGEMDPAATSCAPSPRRRAPLSRSRPTGASSAGAAARSSGTAPAATRRAPSSEDARRPAAARLVACGPRHAVVALADGTVFTWGAGARGRLGHGDCRGQTAPKRVEGLPDGGIISVAAGGARGGVVVAAAGQAAGALYIWGDDRGGQLGQGSGEDDDQPVKRETRKAAIPKQNDADFSTAPAAVEFFQWRGALIRHVACGLHHTLAVAWEPASAGAGVVVARLYAWGFGDRGRLGTGATGAQKLPARVLLPICDDPHSGHVVAAAGGDQHSLALLSDGRVYAFGDNEHGALGLGRASDRPVELPEGVALPFRSGGAVRVSCGARHSACVTASGAVLMWGFSDEGQLGLGPEVASLMHTVVLYRNQSAKVSGRYLSDAAFGDADRIAAAAVVVVAPTTRDDFGGQEEEVVISPVLAPPDDASEGPTPEQLMPNLSALRSRIEAKKKRDEQEASAARTRSAHASAREELNKFERLFARMEVERPRPAPPSPPPSPPEPEPAPEAPPSPLPKLSPKPAVSWAASSDDDRVGTLTGA